MRCPSAPRETAGRPDIVDQGIGSVEKLAHELRDKGTLYFWWN
jgi:hypothetical protein